MPLELWRAPQGALQHYIITVLLTRKWAMEKKGRPFTYHSDDEKPVTISLRIPKLLYTRLQRYSSMYRQSISELVRDGLEWRLEQSDPRQLAPERPEYYD